MGLSRQIIEGDLVATIAFPFSFNLSVKVMQVRGRKPFTLPREVLRISREMLEPPPRKVRFQSVF